VSYTPTGTLPDIGNVAIIANRAGNVNPFCGKFFRPGKAPKKSRKSCRTALAAGRSAGAWFWNVSASLWIFLLYSASRLRSISSRALARLRSLTLSPEIMRASTCTRPSISSG